MRLGVNIDHVATLRNARGGSHPDPIRAAHIALQAGADLITAHLREDRRHIIDDDIERLCTEVPLNLEMASTEAMVAFANRIRPTCVCLVPERREERTTESGLDVITFRERLEQTTGTLESAGIRVSLFIDPLEEQIEAASAIGASAVELNTGAYSNNPDDGTHPGELHGIHLRRLRRGAEIAQAVGLECHAGHGLSYGNVQPVAAIPGIVELNIGHFLIGEAILGGGLAEAIRRMRTLIEEVR